MEMSDHRPHHPLQNIALWRKGCSNTMFGGKPSDCKDCTEGLIDAIEKWFLYESSEMGTIQVHDRIFKVVAKFADTEEGTKAANNFMMENAGTGVILVKNGTVYIADCNDKGKPISQPTPGQWVVNEPEEGKPYYTVRGTMLGTRFKIANVLFVEDSRLTPLLQQREKDEALANARLIVNAKDLYAKAKQLSQNSVAYATGIEAEAGFDLQEWMEGVLAILERIEGDTK